MRRGVIERTFRGEYLKLQRAGAALDLSGNLLPHGDKLPEVASSTWVAPGAYVVGDVRLGEQSSVWYGAVLRGDTEPVRAGARTNIQDGCVLHADPGYPAVLDRCDALSERRATVADRSRPSCRTRR
jgi:carbonic anhydrase/acetyltransferase-like protein (isoleucine patch superfamily)